jgi:predicted metal-dependent peptidase
MTVPASLQPQKGPLPPIDAKMRAKAADVIRKAKVQLAINHPFFGNVVLNRKITLTDQDLMPLGGGKAQVFTACVNAKGHIKAGVRFMSELNVQQAVFLLAHEGMHYMLLHALRRSFRDPRKFNYAADAVINDLLQSSSVGEFIDGGVNMPGSKDKTAEKVYDELPEDQDKGSGSGYQPGSGLDDLEDDGQMDDATARELEQQVKIEIAQAAQVAKAQGKLPVALEKLIDEIVNPITPWHILLERYMTNFIKADYSWARPNKRMMGATGMYLPSSDRLPQMGTVVLQSDESGSIGDAERAHWAGHLNSIMEKCRPEKIILLHTDTQVQKDEEFTLDDLPIPFKTYACGGTDMTAGIKWCEDNGVEPEVFITLTDGYTPFPETEPPFPTVWLITSDAKSPVGDTLKYEME